MQERLFYETDLKNADIKSKKNRIIKVIRVIRCLIKNLMKKHSFYRWNTAGIVARASLPEQLSLHIAPTELNTFFKSLFYRHIDPTELTIKTITVIASL